MPDFADLAAEREQIDTALAIAAARVPAALPPKPCGQCYNCAEPVKSGVTFCDADCRDDWQVRKRAQSMA